MRIDCLGSSQQNVGEIPQVLLYIQIVLSQCLSFALLHLHFWHMLSTQINGFHWAVSVYVHVMGWSGLLLFDTIPRET